MNFKLLLMVCLFTSAVFAEYSAGLMGSYTGRMSPPQISGPADQSTFQIPSEAFEAPQTLFSVRISNVPAGDPTHVEIRTKAPEDLFFCEKEADGAYRCKTSGGVSEAAPTACVETPCQVTLLFRRRSGSLIDARTVTVQVAP